MDLFFKEWWDSGREDPEEFASLVQQYADIVRFLERDACAKLCEERPDLKIATTYDWTRQVGQDLAQAIRMRSNAKLTSGVPTAPEAE